MAGVITVVVAFIWLVSLYVLCETGSPRRRNDDNAVQRIKVERRRHETAIEAERRRQQAAIDADRRAAERAMWQIAKRRWHQ